MKEYFYKTEYTFLYLAKFFFGFAYSFTEIFGAVMLYKNGMSISTILLVYGLRFGLMGICSPLFLKISHRYGVASCALVANIFRILATSMILYGKYQNLVLLVIVMGLPGALANPIEDAISSQYVETRHRGRYNSVRNIAKILGQFLASLVVTWGVLTENNLLLILIVSIFFLLDYLFTAFVDYKPTLPTKNVLKKTMEYIFKSKSSLKEIYSLRTSQIIERQFTPLYLYLALQDFVAFSTVISISLLIQIVTVIVTGKFTDKNLKKTNSVVSAIKVIITGMYLWTKNKFVISINKAVNDNFEKVYETTIQTSIQNIIKKENEEDSVLSTVGQMSLCFTEWIVFLILSFLSLYIQEKVFYVIFVLSILSTIGIYGKVQSYFSNLTK